MKTLILNGSPRKDGNTAEIINMLSEKLTGDIKIINAYTANISPCIDCRYCWENSGCAIKDEMQSVYRYIQECDNIIIASPIYFSELTGKLLDIGSRLQMYYCARFFRNEELISKTKKGAVILVGGGDGSGERAYKTAKILLHQMNTAEIFPLICKHDTNSSHVRDDAKTEEKINELVLFLQKNKKVVL